MNRVNSKNAGDELAAREAFRSDRLIPGFDLSKCIASRVCARSKSLISSSVLDRVRCPGPAKLNNVDPVRLPEPQASAFFSGTDYAALDQPIEEICDPAYEVGALSSS